MKKLFNVLILALAVNFLAVAGGVGYLVRNGNLDGGKVKAIREILFPVPAAVVPTTQPTTQPTMKLEELLAQYAGRSPVEQLQYIRQAFDAQSAQIERAQREMQALKAQVDAAQAAAQRERLAVDAEKKKLEARERESAQMATDKGFQDTLALYGSLPAKQVKSLFMGLDVENAVQFLQAMEPRVAARITKEFKSPEETERLKQIMERMRARSPSASIK